MSVQDDAESPSTPNITPEITARLSQLDPATAAKIVALIRTMYALEQVYREGDLVPPRGSAWQLIMWIIYGRTCMNKSGCHHTGTQPRQHPAGIDVATGRAYPAMCETMQRAFKRLKKNANAAGFNLGPASGNTNKWRLLEVGDSVSANDLSAHINRSQHTADLNDAERQLKTATRFPRESNEYKMHTAQARAALEKIWVRWDQGSDDDRTQIAVDLKQRGLWTAFHRTRDPYYGLT